jgi:sugar/nucleoside kinase (ribokinase family)
MASPVVCGIGQASVDFLGVAPGPLGAESRVVLKEVSIQGGGGAATALAAAAALGARARLSASLVDDEFGRLALRGLAAAGVDCQHVVLRPGLLSPITFTVLAPDRRQRLSFHTAGDVSAAEVDLAGFLAGAAALLLDGSDPPAQLAAARAARRLGVQVFVDVSAAGDGVTELCAAADVLVCSERFAAEVAGHGEVGQSLADLAKLGPRAVIVTQGDAGAVGRFGTNMVRQRAFAVEVADTTGAGHVYLGALVGAWTQGNSPARAMEIASAAAALSCRELGARAGIADLQEILEFLAAA